MTKGTFQPKLSLSLFYKIINTTLQLLTLNTKFSAYKLMKFLNFAQIFIPPPFTRFNIRLRKFYERRTKISRRTAYTFEYFNLIFENKIFSIINNINHTSFCWKFKIYFLTRSCFYTLTDTINFETFKKKHLFHCDFFSSLILNYVSRKMKGNLEDYIPYTIKKLWKCYDRSWF